MSYRIPAPIRRYAALWLALFMFHADSAVAQLSVYTESPEIDGVTDVFVAAVLSEAGYDAEFSVVPWTRLMQLLDSQPNALAFSMTRTPAREDLYHWIGLIRPVNFKLWGLRERVDELPQSLEEARDFRISASRGDVVTIYLDSIGFTNLVYLSESSNGLTMLRRERIDLIAYMEAGIDEFLSARGTPVDALIPVVSLDEISTGHYLVMNKESDPALVELLKESFAAVVASGISASLD